MQRLPPPPATLGPPGRIAATLVAIVLGIGVFMFSLVLFTIVLIVGLVFGGYLWWKTRALRALMREQMAQASREHAAAPSAETTIIEGEYVRIDDAGRELPPRT